MKKYFAEFTTYSSYTPKPLEYTNKGKAIREIREMAEGQVNGMVECRWSVTDETGQTIAEGGRTSGIRFRSI